MADGARSGGAGGAAGRRRRRRRRPSGGAANAAAPSGEAASGAQASTGGSGGGRARIGSRTPAGGGTAGSSTGGAAKRSGAKRSGAKRSGANRSGARRSGAKRSGAKRSGAKRSGAKRSGAKGSATKVPRRGPKPPTKREISAGGVVYRRSEDGIEVVLASRRTRRGQLAWGLAKGGIEDGESMEDAAVREVREETGLRAVIETSLGETRYFYVWEEVRIRKTVHFFLMRHTGGDVDDRDDEMEEIRWFPLERALKRAAYRGERDVLKRAAELLG